MPLLMANTFNWPNAIAQTIESYGQSSRALFAARGLPYPSGNSYSHHIEFDELEDFFAFLCRECNDPLFMLRVNQYFSPTMLDSFGLALISSRNIEDALNRAVNVFNIVSKGIAFELVHEQKQEQEKGTIAIQVKIANHRPLPLCTTMIFSSAHKLVQMLISPDFAFHSLDVDFSLDATQKKRYEQAFHCPVFSDAPCPAFRFHEASLRDILPGSNDELAHLNEKLFYPRLNESLIDNMALQVKVILLNHLSRGECSTAFVASQLNLTPRTLQYQLEKEGTSFKKVLENTRYEQALAYLQQKKSTTEIAHLLGYTDTSNFCRAFRSWTGYSPGETAK